MNLFEYNSTRHYLDRKKERSDIKNVFYPKEINEIYPKSELDPNIIKHVREKILIKLKSYESVGKQMKGSDYKSIILYQPSLKLDNQNYLLNLKVFAKDKNGKLVPNIGNKYVIITSGNNLITFMLYKSQEDVLQKSLNHLRREGYDVQTSQVKVVDTRQESDVININELMEGKELKKEKADIEKSDLPYKVRTDYRKGATLDHEKYGKNKIINTSNGTSGQPGQNGKLDWVEFKVDKPYLSGGKLKDTRIINNVYANSYWLNKD